MKLTFLDFEQPLAELNERIEELRLVQNDSALDISEEVNRLTKKSDELLKSIFKKLDPWKISQLARHPQRPYTLDIISSITTNFIELHGDRAFADDPAIVGGLARFNGEAVVVLGHQKGRDLKERTFRNFGMPRPEGYRKAARLMKLAEKFSLPLLTFVDTPGAYPGIGAEQRGQASAIAHSIECCMSLKVPNISVIIGEGGSGGAIALASSNKVIMLENSIYSVISPEGCASILWRDPGKSLEAAEAMKLSAQDLLKLGVIDDIIPEPLGGAHRNHDEIAHNIKNTILENLNFFESMSSEEIFDHRKNKFLKIGREGGFTKTSKEGKTGLEFKESISLRLVRIFTQNKYILSALALSLIASIIVMLY